MKGGCIGWEWIEVLRWGETSSAFIVHHEVEYGLHEQLSDDQGRDRNRSPGLTRCGTRGTLELMRLGRSTWRTDYGICADYF